MPFRRQQPVVWLVIRNMVVITLEIWWQGSLGKRYVDRPLEMSKAYENIHVLCQCLPRYDFSRGEFLYSSGQDEPFHDYSQPLSPATAVIAQWVHEQSGHCNRNKSHPWSKQHGLPLIKDNLCTAITNNLPAAGANKFPKIAPFPRVISQLPSSNLIMLAHFLDRSGSILFLLEWALTLDVDLLSLLQCLFQNSIYGLIKCFIYHFGLKHIISSDQLTHYTANKVSQRNLYS